MVQKYFTRYIEFLRRSLSYISSTYLLAYTNLAFPSDLSFLPNLNFPRSIFRKIVSKQEIIEKFYMTTHTLMNINTYVDTQ